MRQYYKIESLIRVLALRHLPTFEDGLARPVNQLLSSHCGSI